jgi:hypothetical protein
VVLLSVVDAWGGCAREASAIRVVPEYNGREESS